VGNDQRAQQKGQLRMNDQNGAELRGGMFFCPEALRKLSPGFSLLEPFKLSDDMVRQADVYHQKISEEHPLSWFGGIQNWRRRQSTPAPRQSRLRYQGLRRSPRKHQ